MTLSALRLATISKTNTLRFGFTLAEVLIVLGIIGLIADMTIPTLVQSTQKKVTSVKLKKFYSSMEQAVRLSEIDNGPCLDWEKNPQIKTEDGEVDYEANKSLTEKFFLTYFAPHIRYTTIDKEDGTLIRVILVDGSSFLIHNGSCMDIVYDIDGIKGPNEDGKNIFRFLWCGRDAVAFRNKDQCFGTYFPIHKNSRQDALSGCENTAIDCSVLLEYDNWEFKDDYPFKL